ncbi:MAG TPA: molybdenum cofactor guanylyltransferase [Solirubrobacteraceae bacterium]
MQRPLGAVLAGGRGSRLGGAKATVSVAGRPLIEWPLDALRAALGEVVVVCKRDSELPSLAGVEVVREPDQPTHPLAGIRTALAHAGDRPVLVCAVDLALLTAPTVRALAEADAGGAPAVIARAAGRVQPLLGRYEPAALHGLRSAPPDAALTAAVLALDPAVVDVEAGALLNVNTPADLVAAERAIAQRAQ